jgi:acyl-CoA synthetase (AMP-forming)/AMP-acid ligase II
MAVGRPVMWSEIEDAPLPASLDEFLRRQVAVHGERTLLNYFEEGRTVTYSEFGELVDQMTLLLQRAGVTRGSRVAVMLPGVPEFPGLTFAIARLRAVCVPINVRYTSRELDYVASDAGISAAIVHCDFIDTVADAPTVRALARDKVVLFGDGDVPEWATSAVSLLRDAGSPPTPDETATREDLHYIQYTSGTTGFPKGCLLPQSYWLVAAAAYAGVGAIGNRTLHPFPYFYMSGPLQLCRSMWIGGETYYPGRASLTRFMSWLQTFEIDFCWFPSQLTKLPHSDADRDHSLRRALMHSVDAAGRRAIEERFAILTRDSWSMTETGVGTFVPWDGNDLYDDGLVGPPMPFRQFKVIDDSLQEVPDGVVGELCVRGYGMFMGYHDRPATNAELLLPGGWFRTGDRGRIDERGWVYYQGRAKDMVRRSGENIACEEVESVLRQMPGILDAAVVPVPDEWREEEVKAYVVLVKGESLSSVNPDEIFKWCSERLASFKVPRYLEYRESLPLTASHKIAKSLLVEEKQDLRLDSYDRVDVVWR